VTIAIVTNIDCAGSGKRLAAALARHTQHQIHYVSGSKDGKLWAKAIAAADVIWVKGDNPAEIKKGKFSMYRYDGKATIKKHSGYRARRNAILISSPGGSFFRKKVNGYSKSYGLVPHNMIAGASNFMAPLTPDLNYPELNGLWMPHAWDVERTEYVWGDGPNILVGAYYGQADSKHAAKYLIPAVRRLQKEGYAIKIHSPSLEKRGRVPQQQFLDAMKECTIYFEEITPLGVYGNSGIQAMAYGIPIIASITDTARAQAKPHKNYGGPCLKAYDEDTLVELLRSICKKELDLTQISHETRDYALSVHGYQSIAEQAENIIKAAHK